MRKGSFFHIWGNESHRKGHELTEATRRGDSRAGTEASFSQLAVAKLSPGFSSTLGSERFAAHQYLASALEKWGFVSSVLCVYRLLVHLKLYCVPEESGREWVLSVLLTLFLFALYLADCDSMFRGRWTALFFSFQRWNRFSPNFYIPLVVAASFK